MVGVKQNALNISQSICSLCSLAQTLSNVFFCFSFDSNGANSSWMLQLIIKGKSADEEISNSVVIHCSSFRFLRRSRINPRLLSINETAAVQAGDVLKVILMFQGLTLSYCCRKV